MKIIHCADIHLGSKMDSRLPEDKALQRRREVLSAFGRMLDFAKREGVCAILISGDLFDSDRPFKRDKEFFFGAVAKHPDINFYYLKGNHDIKESYNQDSLENLKCFSDEWRSYDLGDITISGIEITAGNSTSLYTSLSLNPARKNIVMLHGMTSTAMGKDLINTRSLRGNGIDYLALGHIHTAGISPLDERGILAYSGCLEGRGFDECGEKGFLLIDTEKSFKPVFIKNSVRVIFETDIDISSAENAYEAFEIAKASLTVSKESLVRINLCGTVSFSDDHLAQTVESYLADYFYFVSVKNKTRIQPNISAAKDEISIKGEFLRLVLSSELSDNDKNEIISLGLSALGGQEWEL